MYAVSYRQRSLAHLLESRGEPGLGSLLTLVLQNAQPKLAAAVAQAAAELKAKNDLFTQWEFKRVGDVPTAVKALFVADFTNQVKAGNPGVTVMTADPFPDKPGIPYTYLLRRDEQEQIRDLNNWIKAWENPAVQIRRRVIAGQKDWGFLGTGIVIPTWVKVATAVVNPWAAAAMIKPKEVLLGSAVVAATILTGGGAAAAIAAGASAGGGLAAKDIAGQAAAKKQIAETAAAAQQVASQAVQQAQQQQAAMVQASVLPTKNILYIVGGVLVLGLITAVAFGKK